MGSPYFLVCSLLVHNPGAGERGVHAGQQGVMPAFTSVGASATPSSSSLPTSGLQATARAAVLQASQSAVALLNQLMVSDPIRSMYWNHRCVRWACLHTRMWIFWVFTLRVLCPKSALGEGRAFFLRETGWIQEGSCLRGAQ